MALNKAQKEFAGKLAERLIEITHPAVKTEELVTDEMKRDQAIVDAAYKVGGCATSNLIELLELVVGHKLPAPTGRIEGVKLFPAGTVVHLTGNTNSHDYKLGSECVVYRDDSDYGVKDTGRAGNHLPFTSMDEFENNGRLATPEEIQRFTERLTGNITTAIGDVLMMNPATAANANEFLTRVKLFETTEEGEE